MWIVFDILLLAIVVVCVLVCRSKGFVSAVLGVGVFVVSLLLALWLSNIMAPFVYDNFVRESIVQEVNDKYGEGEQGFLGSLIVDKINESEEARTSGNYTPSAIERSAISTIRSLLFVVLFLILSIVLRIVSRLMKGINKIPLVGGINRLLGGVMGLIIGLLFAYLAVSLCAIIIAASADQLTWMNTAIVDKTLLFSLVYKYNLLRIL